MKDIQNRQDLELLTKVFYDKLLLDDRVNYIFTEVAKIDLEHHLPIITDFWEQSIFHTSGYKNNVFQIHQTLNHKEKLSTAHFDVWLDHFYQTVDAYFEGENAEKIKTRALSIATILKIKLQ